MTPTRPDLAALERAIARPQPFAPHDGPFWDDPYIASRMLDAHLDPTTDAASRRPATIDRTVDHLMSALLMRPGQSLLDLGCGPGLYATRFASDGLRVTGIDLSRSSIDHAQRAAAVMGLAIDYRLGDYTQDPLGGPFDAAVLIYLDFGVLPDGPRDRLLDSVRASLRPGGAFAFDVHAPPRPRPPDGGVTVHHSQGGFWRPAEHLVIDTTFRYGRDLDLAQTAVVDTDGTITVYRVWDRAYGLRDLRRLLRRHGLVVDRAWSDLAGEPWRRGSPTLAVAARRR